MFADVMIFLVDLGAMDRAIRHFQDSVTRAAVQQVGFSGMLLLTNRNSSQVIAVLLWETEADRLAATGSPDKQLNVLLAAPVNRTLEHARYDVSIQVEITTQGHAHVRGI